MATISSPIFADILPREGRRLDFDRPVVDEIQVFDHDDGIGLFGKHVPVLTQKASVPMVSDLGRVSEAPKVPAA